jgi:hypothetical protein
MTVLVVKSNLQTARPWGSFSLNLLAIQDAADKIGRVGTGLA